MDHIGDHVADIEAVTVFGGKLRRVVEGDAGDACRVMPVGGHRRSVAEAVVRLAKRFVIAAPEQLGDRLRMAIGVVGQAPAIKAHAERIHLSPRDLLDRRAIRTEAVGIPRLHPQDHRSLASQFHLRVVAKTVARVDPAVGHEPQGVLIAMGVREVERTKQHLALFRPAIAILVRQLPQVRNRPHDRLGPRAERQNANGDVQLVGEFLRPLRPAVRTEVGQDRQAVAGLRGVGGGERILDRVRHPQPSPRVKGQIHRLLNLRLRRHQLDLEAGRQFEMSQLFRRRQRLGRRHRRAGERQRAASDEKAAMASVVADHCDCRRDRHREQDREHS